MLIVNLVANLIINCQISKVVTMKQLRNGKYIGVYSYTPFFLYVLAISKRKNNYLVILRNLIWKIGKCG